MHASCFDLNKCRFELKHQCSKDIASIERHALYSNVSGKAVERGRKNEYIMEKEFISYSNLLIDFIDPLLTGQEDEVDFLNKAKLGQVAWNFSVSDTNNLPLDDIHKIILLDMTKKDSKLKEVLNMLVQRKALKYSRYNQFIFRLEIRENRHGQKTLYAESAPADKLKWKNQ